MKIYQASYEEHTVNEVDAVGDFYAGSLEACLRWARTQLDGAEDGDEVTVDRVTVRDDLSPRKLVLNALNGAAYVRERVLVARLIRVRGRTLRPTLDPEDFRG